MARAFLEHALAPQDYGPADLGAESFEGRREHHVGSFEWRHGCLGEVVTVKVLIIIGVQFSDEAMRLIHREGFVRLTFDTIIIDT